jgi:hypothetical protein
MNYWKLVFIRIFYVVIIIIIIIIITYLPTPCSTVLLEKLTGPAAS